MPVNIAHYSDRLTNVSSDVCGTKRKAVLKLIFTVLTGWYVSWNAADK